MMWTENMVTLSRQCCGMPSSALLCFALLSRVKVIKVGKVMCRLYLLVLKLP